MTEWTSFFDGILTEKQFRVDEPMSRHHVRHRGPADVFVAPDTEETLQKVLNRAYEGASR